ncbi:MAG TPA: sugar transferase [Candidatus Saccharimonadales bacterium]|nr:sugar transferase [Candidatus Saccharimonadales bacterium]
MGLEVATIQGPLWHDSLKKREEDALYAQGLEEMAIRVTSLALLALSNEIEGVQIIERKRVGLYGQIFGLRKTQTHKEPASKLGTTMPETPIAKFVNEMAIDEFIQIKHVSKDPRHPLEMSFVGPRPQEVEEIEDMRDVMYAAGYQLEFDVWLSRYCQMRPGIFGLGSLIDRKYPKPGLQRYMARTVVDGWYFLHGSSDVDALICGALVKEGAKRMNQVFA